MKPSWRHLFKTVVGTDIIEDIWIYVYSFACKMFVWLKYIFNTLYKPHTDMNVGFEKKAQKSKQDQ